MKITLGHSPDSDDAFMFYGLAEHKVDAEGFDFEHVLRDIETLNRWALDGRLHVTAVSVHGYAYVADRYAILPQGASMGEGYGPILVARRNFSRADLHDISIAVPGTMTSAFLALRLWLGEFNHEVIPFDRIMDAVAEGVYDAGLLIHEGQLTHGSLGLTTLVDLGKWWADETNLPLPLGINVIRRDLGEETMGRVARVLRHSIEYGLAHRAEALDHALRYARGMSTDVADRFVGMYVNRRTLDLGDDGRESIRLFLKRGYEAEVIDRLPDIEFVSEA